MPDQRVVLDALFKDIELERKSVGSIDAVFFTGDLVGKGKYSSETHNVVSDRFIRPLLKASEIASDRFFMVPGNHDVEQTRLPDALRPVFGNLQNTEAVNGLLDQINSMPYLWAGLENFNKLREKFVASPRIVTNPLFESYRVTIAGRSVGICAINSAWRASGKANDFDYGELLIGQRQLDILSQSVSDCDFKIALLHHPISWLVQFDQSVTYRHLYSNFNAVFFGHNHMADLAAMARPSGKTFLSNAGCLYQGRNYFNGYTLATYDFDSDKWDVKVREYYEERGVFSASERFAPGGTATFNLGGASAQAAELLLPTQEFLETITETINSQLLSSTISDIAPRNLKQLFVAPQLCTISEKKVGNNGGGEKIEYCDLLEIIKKSEPVLFVGPKESGKTTILNYICANANEFPDANGVIIGCYVNLHTLPRHTRAAFLEAMTSFAGGTYSRAQLLELLKLGRLAVCLDNFDPQNSKLTSLIKDFFNEFSGNKVYISTVEDVQASLNEATVTKFFDSQQTVYIHSFGRRQTRELMKRWFNEDAEISSDQVDGILESLKRLNIPRTPFLVSVFLWVREKRIAFDPVNHAEIIDTLIDGMLDKFSEAKSRTRLDSTVKRHFLTDLAHHLYQENRDRLTHNELDLFTAEYFKKKLLTSASGPFIEELKQKGIFLDLGEEICFKFDCLRAFFLSIRLQESSSFFELALTPSEFLKLGEELDYFTGKQRGRQDALERSLELLDKFFEPIALNIDLALFDEVTFTEFPISDEDRKEIGKELYPPRPSEAEREAILDEIDVHEAKHTIIVTNGQKPKLHGAVPDFVAALQITSKILRNSELIDNAQLKIHAYRKIIRYWSQILLVVLLAIELRDEAEELKVLKELEKSLPATGLDIGVLFKLFAPRSIFGLTLDSLGTNQLEIVIKEHANTADHCIEQLLSTILQIDLSLNDYLDSVDKFLKRNEKQRFSAALIMLKLIEIYTLKPMSDASASRMQKTLSSLQSMIVADGNLKLAQRNANKMLFLESIKKRRSDGMKKAND